MNEEFEIIYLNSFYRKLNNCIFCIKDKHHLQFPYNAFSTPQYIKSVIKNIKEYHNYYHTLKYFLTPNRNDMEKQEIKNNMSICSYNALMED